MKKSTKENHSFKLKIKRKGHEAISYNAWELISVCWDYIYELETGNPSLYLTNDEMLDSLKQNFYTCKMILNEFGSELSSELESIELFIHKHTKRLYLAEQLREIENSDHKIFIDKSENNNFDFQ